MDERTRKALRALPSVEEVLSHPEAGTLTQRYRRELVVEAVRRVVEETRRRILEGAAGATASGAAGGGATDLTGGEALAGGSAVGGSAAARSAAGSAPADTSPSALLKRAALLLASWEQPGLRRVLNLSGVVIHTNLGRSRLAESALERVVEVARAYSTLEYDLQAGERGSREVHVEALLTLLTGAEAAFAVNNNAGAVLLLLMGLAAGREVIVSRGQLVEIGGSFRLPDIMRAGGVRLVEVGTTNRTRLTDYEAALTPETAMLLRVHTSNFRILGFTEEVALADLVELGRRRGLIVADDLGSGALSDLDAYRGEPSVASSLRAGADVVCFSGDKLLGGPQAGILVGRREVIDRLRKHPVARALRLDKMTLAALEATLQLHQDPERAQREIPTLRYLTRSGEETARLAGLLQAAIERRCGQGPVAGLLVEVVETGGRAGGGSMPLLELPSHAVRMRFPEVPVETPPGGTARPAGAAGGPGGSLEADVPPPGRSSLTATMVEAALRHAPVPVVARISQDCLLLDVLALEEDEVEEVATSVAWALAELGVSA
jgi:L-seryl-tRNA(Ser) seleniumtransferase